VCQGVSGQRLVPRAPSQNANGPGRLGVHAGCALDAAAGSEGGVGVMKRSDSCSMGSRAGSWNIGQAPPGQGHYIGGQPSYSTVRPGTDTTKGPGHKRGIAGQWNMGRAVNRGPQPIQGGTERQASAGDPSCVGPGIRPVGFHRVGGGRVTCWRRKRVSRRRRSRTEGRDAASRGFWRRRSRA